MILEEKNVLIDTVFKTFSGQFTENLSQEIGLSKIDYIVCNHAEPDHSGAIPDLMELIPGTPIYCTKNCVKSLQGHYHKNWNFKIVKTGDRLSLGNGKELVFIQAPMLHWPAFGCYGWHDTSTKIIGDLLKESGFEIVSEPLSTIWEPDSKLLARCVEYGRQFVADSN